MPLSERKREELNFSNVFGILTAFIGLTSTLNGGWKYLASPERTKKERISAIVVISVIGLTVLGVAFGVSHVTAYTAVGKQSVPGLPIPTATQAPSEQQAAPASTEAPASPTIEITPSATPTATDTPTVVITPTEAPSPTMAPTQQPTMPPTAPAP